MHRILLLSMAGMVYILLLVGHRTVNVEARQIPQHSSARAGQSLISSAVGAGNFQQTGAPQDQGGSYFANPLPPIHDGTARKTFGSDATAASVPDVELQECYETIVNPSFETNGGWYGQPSSNVGFTVDYWNTGVQSIFLNTNFYSNSALWQTIYIPEGVESATLSFYSGLVFSDPGEVVYISIYDEFFSDLLFSNFLVYDSIGAWQFFGDNLSVELLAGRTIQLTFQVAQDYDEFYSEIAIDDVSLALCSTDVISLPTPSDVPTSTPTATPEAPPATSTPTPTLLPTNTPTATPQPATPQAGTTVDLAIAGVQVGQALMADVDPVTGAPVPLIAEKPALARVFVDVSGTDSVDNLDGTLFLRDAQNTVHTVRSLNGPIQLIGDSTAGSPGSTLNFLLDIALLKGQVDVWAQLDPTNLIPEVNEDNNVSAEAAHVFQPGKKLRIAWVEANQGVDRAIAQTGDSDLRKIFPVGVNDVEYFFQPGFSQQISAQLTTQNYSQFFNALNRFWDQMTHEGNWVGGSVPDRLYGWTAGQNSGLCGVADASWAGGRGRVAVGYALGCGAETMAHEVGHIFDGFGLRHTPNRPASQDPNCVGPPGGPEPQYPAYPNLPTGSIGVVGFDAAKLQIIFPNQAYDFMSYCAPEWISPFNYSRMVKGFGPTAAVAAASQEEVSTKLLVSGLVYTGTLQVELDPFYMIRSEVAPDASSGDDYCIELRDESNTTLDTRCFDLGFIDIETGEPTEVDGFSLVAPYVQAMKKLVITHAGNELASRSVSTNQPFVRLTNPVGGGNLSGDTVNVTWNGADLDGDTLFYSLAYSTDAGQSWLPLATDLTATSTVVDLTSLPGSNQVQFRIGASDGINTVYDTSDSLEIGFVGDNTITVRGKPPTATIRTEITRVDAGSAVVLEGTGYDLEDGLLPEADLRWWSNRDGVLGTGSWLQKALSTGEHTITFTVTDSNGNQNTATKTLLVGVESPPESQGIFLPLVAGS